MKVEEVKQITNKALQELAASLDQVFAATASTRATLDAGRQL